MRRYLAVNLDVALLVLRLALAAVLLYHGIPKLFNFGETVTAFTAMNIPAPTLSVVVAILAEVVGGILILLGVAVDIAGILVVIDMLGAIFAVHWAAGFDFTKGGWEHPFTVLAMALTLAFAGPGRYSAAGGRRGTGRVAEAR